MHGERRMKLVERFLVELARGWEHASRPKLRIIGSAALILQTDYVRGTKDSDVLRTVELDDATSEKLLDLGGEESLLAARWNHYLDIVPNGVPFLPHAPRWHPLALPDAPQTLSFEVLDVVDVVVSKLKRFGENDRSDIAAMIERELVPHAQLVERFMSAVDEFSHDARADQLPRYVRNLNEIERDVFGAERSVIELPDWVE
jgi:hypothetical protein